MAHALRTSRSRAATLAANPLSNRGLGYHEPLAACAAVSTSAPLAQLAEHLTLNQRVVGSSPTGSSKPPARFVSAGAARNVESDARRKLVRMQRTSQRAEERAWPHEL